METIKYLLSKAGPRLLNVMVDSPQIDIIVTAPGMLFQRLELVTNLGAFEGCDADFYSELASDMEGTIFCGHQAPIRTVISVQTHRVGTELTIDLDPLSMYQSLIRLRTRSGRSFNAVVNSSLGTKTDLDVIAVFNAIRATGHHEHHPSAAKLIRENSPVSHQQH
jgi:hypothetical protein